MKLKLSPDRTSAVTRAITSPDEHSTPNRRGRVKRKVTSVLATVAMAITAIAGGLSVATPASAATQGPGGMWSQNGDFVGAFVLPDGTLTYCVDPEVTHQDFQPSGGLVNEITPHEGGGTRHVVGDDLKRINYAITVYGQTSDSATAAAVQAYVWTVTNSDGRDGFYYLGTAPQSVRDQYVAIANAVEANYNASAGGTGTGTLVFDVDPMNNYLGTLNVSNLSPADALGTITLTNGIFSDTGSATRDGVVNGGSYPVIGVPPDDAVEYKIRAEGAFTGSGGTQVDANVALFDSAPAGWQRSAAKGTSTPGVSNFTLPASDPMPRSTIFEPVVGTKVSSKLVQAGEEYADVVTFDVADGSQPWRQARDGRYAPVTARWTAYGMLASEPAEAANVPAGTPILAQGTFTTDPATGPTVDYTVPSGVTASETGYVTWVWEILQSDQSSSAPNVQMLLPDGYHFIDRYGQVVETSFTPMEVTASSQVAQPVVSPGDTTHDTLTVSSNGWIDGTTGTFVGKVYAVTDGSIPTRSDTVPTTNVRLVETQEIVATGPGDYQSPDLTVPEDAGHLVWVWSFDASQQDDPSKFPAGYTWKDDWAMPKETQRVLFEPKVTTRAVVEVAKGEEFVDVLDAFAATGQWIDGTDVLAKGTLYGPFLAAPDESAEVPSWAPIAGTTEATLDQAGEHTVRSGIISQEAGFYTWVWEIHAADQSAQTQARIPADYSFVDAFAQQVETSITPSSFAPVSKVTKPKVALSEGVQDTVFVQLAAGSGGWLQVHRQRVPVVFHGTAYFVPGADAPAVSATPPAGAEVQGTSQFTATGEGWYESAILPGETYRQGHTSWVWEIRSEDQPEEYRAMITEWADSFGLPDETQEVLVPKIATKAQPDAAIGQKFTDTAIVTGTMPVPGMDLHFELYKATKDSAGNWVCDAGNLLWTSEKTRITSTGEYVSAPAPGQLPGTYHWVEVATATDGNEISRGVCGEPDETTKVTGPEVTTKAQSAPIGAPITDVATVTGPVSAEAPLDLTFEAYYVPMVKDTETGDWVIDTPAGADGLDWVCEAEPVFTTADQPLRVTGEGEYTSAAFTPDTLGQYFWVETLSYTPEGGTPVEVHRGKCGLRAETSFVVDVTTMAQLTADAGGTATDTATLNGIFPEGSTLVFHAYQVPADAPQAGQDGAAALCTADTLIASTEPVEVPGDTMLEAVQIESAKVDMPTSLSNYKVYWVEEVVDEHGSPLTVGTCGLPNETTQVSTSVPDLVVTGLSVARTGFLVFTALGFLAVGATLMVVRRRRAAQREEVTTLTE